MAGRGQYRKKWWVKTYRMDGKKLVTANCMTDDYKKFLELYPDEKIIRFTYIGPFTKNLQFTRKIKNGQPEWTVQLLGRILKVVHDGTLHDVNGKYAEFAMDVANDMPKTEAWDFLQDMFLVQQMTRAYKKKIGQELFQAKV